MTGIVNPWFELTTGWNGTLAAALIAPSTLLAEEPSPGPGPMLWVFGGLMVLYILVVTIFPARQQKKELELRLQKFRNMQKNEPVVTSSGIYGKFVSISEDGLEVTIRVDDNSRLRMRPEVVYADNRGVTPSKTVN